MKKVLLADVVFNPGAADTPGTLDFSSVDGFDSRALLAVLHGPFNKLIYGKTIGGKGGTFDGALLTLELDVHLLAADAPLTIMYDSSVFQIGNWPTDYPDSAAAVLLNKILAKFGQAGMTWDGASTPGLEPVLSNNGRTVTWLLDETFIYGATKSTFAISSGAYFTATRVSLTGDYNASAILGYATAAFNPADFGSLSGTSIAVSSGTMSANNSAIGADYAVLNAHTLADGDLIVTYVDRGGNAWHGVVPAGQAYDDLQDMVGLGETPLGMVAGTLYPFVAFEGAALTDTASMSLTALTDAELADIEFVPKPGYDNTTAGKALAVDLDGLLAALQAPLPLPQNAAKENGGNLTAIAAGVKQALAAMAGGAGITWTSLDVATHATVSFTPMVATFVPSDSVSGWSWIHASLKAPRKFRARFGYSGADYANGYLTFGVIDPTRITLDGVQGTDLGTGAWNGFYCSYQGIFAVGNRSVAVPGILLSSDPMPDGGEGVIWIDMDRSKMAIMTHDREVHDNLQGAVEGLVSAATAVFCGYRSAAAGPSSFSITGMAGLPAGVSDPDWFVDGVDLFAAPGLAVDAPRTQTLLQSVADKLDTLIAASSTTNTVLASINTAVANVKTAVDAVTTAVDAVNTSVAAGNVSEASLVDQTSTLTAALAALQTLATAGNTALGTLHSDGLAIEALITTGNTALAAIQGYTAGGSTAAGQASALTALGTLHTDLTTCSATLLTIASNVTALGTTLGAGKSLADVVTALNPLATDADVNAMSTALQSLETSELAKLTNIDSKLGGTLTTTPLCNVVSTYSDPFTATGQSVTHAVPAGANFVEVSLTGAAGLIFAVAETLANGASVNLTLFQRSTGGSTRSISVTTSTFVTAISNGATSITLSTSGSNSSMTATTTFITNATIPPTALVGLQAGNSRAAVNAADATLVPLTTATLTNGGSFTGTALDCFNVASGAAGASSYAKEYRCMALSDKACTLYINDSANNSTFYPWQQPLVGVSTTTNLSAVFRAEFSGPPKQRFVQPVITNTSGTTNGVCVLTHSGFAA